MEISPNLSYAVLPKKRASAVGQRLASGRATPMDDPLAPYDALIRSGARRLTGYQRRLFQAEVAAALCGGSPRLAERRFGRGRDTAENGLPALRSGMRRREGFAAEGRKRSEGRPPDSLPTSARSPSPMPM